MLPPSRQRLRPAGSPASVHGRAPLDHRRDVPRGSGSSKARPQPEPRTGRCSPRVPQSASRSARGRGPVIVVGSLSRRPDLQTAVSVRPMLGMSLEQSAFAIGLIGVSRFRADPSSVQPWRCCRHPVRRPSGVSRAPATSHFSKCKCESTHAKPVANKTGIMIDWPSPTDRINARSPSGEAQS